MLLTLPHHDGSPLYVSDEAPALGTPAAVRMRSRADDPNPITDVWLRTQQDAEPTYHPCLPGSDAQDDGTVWWQGTLPMRNPVMRYRFLIVRTDGSQQWLTGAGLVDHDVPDAEDFVLSVHEPAPAWARDAVVYQIFPDRFARSAAADQRPTPHWAVPAAWDDEVVFEGSDPRTPLQFYGGDLDGITEHLDHIATVGADVVYTTPVFPGESNHRYNATSFDRVDDLLGGDEAYRRLSDAVHERGWRILGDLTTNHTGDTHEWFQRALADPASPERDFYYFSDNGGYETWMGHHTLPKIDHANPTLRHTFVEGPDSIVGRWLQPPFSADGWRIDVANMTGRCADLDVNHEVQRAVRATVEELRPDGWVIGEHNHDASGDVEVGGWHGVMNYSGFSWPVWEWVRGEQTRARSFGTPAPVPRRTGPQITRTMQRWLGRLGWKAFSGSWNILGSHDSARIRTLTDSSALHRVAAGLQFTLPGVPMIFAGDEIGLPGVLGEDSRRPMPWDRRELWETDTLQTYAALAALRREHAALRRGGLRWAVISDDVIAYLREHEAGTVLVCARRAASGAVELPAHLLPLGPDGVRLLLDTSRPDAAGTPVPVEDGVLSLPATDAPGLSAYLL